MGRRKKYKIKWGTYIPLATRHEMYRGGRREGDGMAYSTARGTSRLWLDCPICIRARPFLPTKGKRNGRWSVAVWIWKYRWVWGGGAGLGVFTPSTNRLCSIQTALCILVNTKPTTWSIWAQDTRNFGCLDGFFVLLALPPPVISSDALNLPWQFWKMAKRDEARTPAPVISFLLQPLGRLLSTTWKHKTPSSCLMISSGRFFSLFTFSTP